MGGAHALGKEWDTEPRHITCGVGGAMVAPTELVEWARRARGRWFGARTQSGMQAVTVISTTSSGEFSAATVTVVRAGLLVGKYFAYSSL
jgi:hypothetical protein